MGLTSMNLGDYLDQTAAKQPTPGGGGMAGLVGALAAALGEMVLAYSLGRGDLAQHQDQLQECMRSVHAMRLRLVELAEADEVVFGHLSDVMRMPKDSPDRKAELAKAALGAAKVPLDVIRVCSEMMLCFEAMAGITNRHLKSDLAIAAILTEAVARASRWNIASNHSLMDGMAFGLMDDADGLLERISAGSRRTAAACA